MALVSPTEGGRLKHAKRQSAVGFQALTVADKSTDASTRTLHVAMVSHAPIFGMCMPCINMERHLPSTGLAAHMPLASRCRAGAEDAELDTYKERIGSAKSIPEQCFGGSHLRLTHAPSGVCLAFTALDALQAWWADDRPPVQVGAAQDWLRSRQKDVETSGAVTLEYDWCACYFPVCFLSLR